MSCSPFHHLFVRGTPALAALRTSALLLLAFTCAPTPSLPALPAVPALPSPPPQALVRTPATFVSICSGETLTMGLAVK
ncbi:hypothetical protein B0H14DRAFT_3459311 [Mycena olivaceomarginata]|nr:hypothetical protein B0H14DRAFT_3459311 [Mycena olivaceomarginata]